MGCLLQTIHGEPEKTGRNLTLSSRHPFSQRADTTHDLHVLKINGNSAQARGPDNSICHTQSTLDSPGN